MEQKVVIHPFNHSMVGKVEAIDIEVTPHRDGNYKVFFRISWYGGEIKRGWFLAFVPQGWSEFCLLVYETEPITYVIPGLQPAKDGQPVLIMSTCQTVAITKPELD